MKVNIITELFLPHIGGQEIRYYRFGKELVRRGNIVNIYTINYSRGLNCRDTMNGINIFRIFDIKGYVKQYKRSYKGIIRFSSQLRMFLEKSLDLDVFIINEMPLLHILYNYSLIRGMNAIVDWAEHWSETLYIPFFKRIAYCANKHIVVNKKIFRHLLRYGVKRDRIKWVPPAIDLKVFRCNSNIKKYGSFIYIGRLVKHKNIDMIIKAFSVARKHDERMRLIIIGEGPEKRILKDLAFSLGLDDRVFFKGLLNHEEVVALLKRSYGFLLASEREGFSWAVLEALASGTPVITTDFPNNYAAEIIRQSGGGLVVKPSYKELSYAMLRLLDDKLWNELHINAIEFSKKYDIRSITRLLENFLIS